MCHFHAARSLSTDLSGLCLVALTKFTRSSCGDSRVCVSHQDINAIPSWWSPVDFLVQGVASAVLLRIQCLNYDRCTSGFRLIMENVSRMWLKVFGAAKLLFGCCVVDVIRMIWIILTDGQPLLRGITVARVERCATGVVAATER